MHVWTGPTPSNGLGRESDQAGTPGLAHARLQHLVAAPEDAECGHRSEPRQRGTVPADRQHWRENAGRRRMEDEEARGRLLPALAQGAPGH